MKKLIALILSAMMVMSITAVGMMSVSAEETGSLKITKKIEDTTKRPNEKIGLNGVTFKLYQVFAKTDNGYQITKTEYQTALDEYTGSLTKVGENTYATYGSTDQLQNQIGALLAVTNSTTPSYTKTEPTTQNVNLTGITTDTVDGSDPAVDLGETTITDIPYGVYLVVETGVPAGYTFTQESQPFLVNISGATTVDAMPKNQKHPLTKDIKDADNSNALVNTKSFEIGDTVPYVVKTTVPNYNPNMIQGLKEQEDANKEAYLDEHSGATSGWATPFSSIPFYFTDTLSKGLTLNLPTDVEGATAVDAFTVKVGPAGSQTVLQKDTDFTVEETTSGTSKKYTININFASLYTDKTTNYLGKDVEITYSATLNKDAVVTDGNPNEIKLYFRNNPSIDTNPVEFSNTDKDPVVYTYQMELEKLLDNQKFSAIRGEITAPKFKLSTKSDGTEYITVAETTNNVKGDYVLDPASSREDLELTTDGTLTVKGLKKGTYYLYETTAASVDGVSYTPLGAPIAIVVDDVKASGELTGVVNAVLEGTTDNLMKQVQDPSSYDTPEPEMLDSGIFALSISNPKSQFDIPETGGLGILIFTIGGAVLLAGAIIIFSFARKKKKDN